MATATTTHTPIQRTLRTTRPVPTIFPTTITVSRITGHRLIITLPPPISGDRTFATIRGMTTVGIRVRTGMDTTRIGALGTVTVMGHITAVDMDIAAIAEEIIMPAGRELSAPREVVMDC